MLCVKCGKNPIRHRIIKWCNSCYVIAYRKARPGYASWGANGYKALIRDNFTCQSCKKNKDQLKGTRLDLHHLDGNGSSKPHRERNNSVDNLITLCSPCHTKVEFLRRGNPNKGLQGRWSYHFEKCISCGKTNSRYMGKGLCNRCYQYPRRAYKAEKQRYYEQKWKSQANPLTT
jgi:5-methylcytosine-specific restriction endonuclease McrA